MSFHRHPNQEDIKEGMVLIYEERRGSFHTVDLWGRVAKITPKGTVTFIYSTGGEKREKQFRPPYRELRIPTDHEIATREWKRAWPETEVLKIYKTGFGYRPENGYRLELNLDTDEPPKGYETVEAAIDKVQEELAAFKKWYAAKPKKDNEKETDEDR